MKMNEETTGDSPNVTDAEWTEERNYAGFYLSFHVSKLFGILAEMTHGFLFFFSLILSISISSDIGVSLQYLY